MQSTGALGKTLHFLDNQRLRLTRLLDDELPHWSRVRYPAIRGGRKRWLFFGADLLKCPNLPTLPSVVINNLNIVRTESHSVKNHAQAIEHDSALNATSLSATSPELKLTEGI